MAQKIRTLESQLYTQLAPIARKHSLNVQQSLPRFEGLALIIKNVHKRVSLDGFIVLAAVHQHSDDAAGVVSYLAAVLASEN